MFVKSFNAIFSLDMGFILAWSRLFLATICHTKNIRRLKVTVVSELLWNKATNKKNIFLVIYFS